MSNGLHRDPDDFFAETRMSFGDHIEELRQHLWKAIYGFGFALFFSLFIGHIIVKLITAPVKDQLEQFYERRAKKIRAEQADDPKLMLANEPTPFRKIWVPRKQFAALAKGESGEMKERPKIVTKEEIDKEKAPPPWYRKWWEKLGGSDKGPPDPDE